MSNANDNPSEDLQLLREQLGDIDRKLLELVKDRQALAQRIGVVKSENGKATRDFAQEANVLRRARDTAESMGLDGSIAEELMLVLIKRSLIAQERDRVARAHSGSGKRALIIGGAGKMGRWFARFLDSQGYDIEVADPSAALDDYPQHDDWRELTLDHELIVVAAPLGASAEILRGLAVIKPKGIVFDIGSLKSPLRDALRETADAGVKVMSMHPMFGPSIELLSGAHVICIDLGYPEANELARQLFASTMATLVDMDLESHDRLIAYVLGLSHALNLSFTTALAESGEAAPQLAKLSSTTFNAQLQIATKVSQENPNLYFEIQHLNDYGTESLSALLYAVERLRSVVRAGDQQGFVALMERTREFLDNRESHA